MFNPYDPAFHSDPYISYAALRDGPSIYRTNLNGWNMVLLTRHADITAALRSPRLGRSQTMSSPEAMPSPYRAIMVLLSNWMLLKNPPDHTRLRSLVNRAFTPRVVEQLEPRIALIAAELLADARERGTLELISDFAFPLPVIVIAELLGVPAEDRALFRRWSEVLVANIDLFQDDTTWRAGSQVAGEISNYLRDLIVQRRAAPRDDLLSALVAAEDGGDRLSEDELIANCSLLLAAGHETTVNLIGNGTLALLRNPNQLTMLRQEPALIDNAVEELLRYESPVQMTSRDVLADFELPGGTLSAGEECAAGDRAGNRDPEVFADPDRLDIQRSNAVKHLAFAAGIHFVCRGSARRAEGRAAFQALLTLGELRLRDPEPPLRPTIALRGRSRIALAVEGGARGARRWAAQAQPLRARRHQRC
ncbi:cytochrome P450 [Candidatus Gracilibacteria bacterium]|nr:cytochrome P450 [Candidatus Gracilibacteria bacterium]